MVPVKMGSVLQCRIQRSRDAHTQSICQVAHAEKSHDAWEEFAKNSGPTVVGATQGASCFGPAYEFAFIADTELRKRKIREKVPIT